MTEEDRKKYEVTLRENLLKHIDDLREKISSNEIFPHGSQDLESLVEIDDNIEACLNCWYY